MMISAIFEILPHLEKTNDEIDFDIKIQIKKKLLIIKISSKKSHDFDGFWNMYKT